MMPDAIEQLITDLEASKISSFQQPIVVPVADFVAALNEIETAIGGGIIPSTIVLTDNHILVGNASNVATDVPMSGDATIVASGQITVTKSGGVAFGSAAFDSASAFDAAGTAAAAVAAIPDASSSTFGLSKVDGTTITAAAGVLSANPASFPAGTIPVQTIVVNNHKVVKGNGSNQGAAVDDLTDIILVLDGGGSALASGARFNTFIDFGGTIQQVTMLADQSGSVNLDIQVCSYANYAPGTHPVSGDSITGASPPDISTASKYQDATLTGWTTALTAGSCVSLTATGAATSITRVTCALKVAKN